MMNRVTRYVLLVTTAGAVATIAVYLAAPGYDRAFLEAALYLSGLGLLAELLVYKLPRGAHGSISFIPFLAAAIVSPNWIAVATVSTAYLAAEIIRRKSLLKITFNIAQTLLGMSVAILVYLSIGGESLLESHGVPLVQSTRTGFLPALLLMALVFVINSVSVSGVIAASENKKLLQVWKQNTLGTITYDVVSSPIVYLLAWVFVEFGPLGAAVFAIPLLGVRQLYKTNFELEQVNRELLQLMVKAIEARDPYTSGHSRRVAHYSRIIARAIGLNARRVEHVATAALLHDVGKIHEVYAPILRKPDRLTPDEWAIMQTHPIRSAELVATVSHLQELVAPLRHHHENWDGSGYPDGLSGEAIPLESRIIMFADTIDAMTTDRPYRKALGEKEVRSEFVKQRGRQFDPVVCDKLLASPLCPLLFTPSERELTPLTNRVVARPPKSRLAIGA